MSTSYRSSPITGRAKQHDTADRLTRARRWVALHRRPLSAAMAFCSVLFTVGALSPADADPPSAGSAGTSVAIDDGLLEVPVQLSDPAVAQLLRPGDTVDVLGADPRGPAEVVGAELLVVSVPEERQSSWTSGSGDSLVVLAASQSQALALADAASRGPLTVARHP